jgi:putative heme iron utilization protein
MALRQASAGHPVIPLSGRDNIPPHEIIVDSDTQHTLARLIRNTRIAALGTIHKGEPNLAMMSVAVEDDFSAFYIHASKLGRHTRDMESDPQVSLLITETDDGRADPQTLARLSIHGTADPLPRGSADYLRVKDLYLKRFPASEKLFDFGDFNLWRITPTGGRFVAGFGKAFNIVPEALRSASTIKA